MIDMIFNFDVYDRNNLKLLNSKDTNCLFIDFHMCLFGTVMVHELVPLKELIYFLNKVQRTTSYYGTEKYSFELTGKYNRVFTWSRENDLSLNHLLTKTTHSTNLVWRNNIPTKYLNGAKQLFFIRLMREFIQAGLFEYAKKYGEYFFEKPEDIEYKYKIAEKVKTVLNENVNTERIGFIIGKWYHIKEKSNMYFLMIDGKKYKKRYFERDLEIVNNQYSQSKD